MTLDELRDWHARRAGWNEPGTEPERTGDFVMDAMRQTLARGSWWKIVGNDFQRSSNHPFPPTLDGADASFPKGWEWGRTPPRGDWCAVSLERGITEQTAYTGDKPRDLYELSKLAWEQEAAR